MSWALPRAQGQSVFPCTPSPDRRLLRASDPCFQIESTPSFVCYRFESIKSCWRNPGCRREFHPLPPPRIPGLRPPEAQKAAGHAAPGRFPLPGRVHPAAFRLPPAPSAFADLRSERHSWRASAIRSFHAAIPRSPGLFYGIDRSEAGTSFRSFSCYITHPSVSDCSAPAARSPWP